MEHPASKVTTNKSNYLEVTPKDPSCLLNIVSADSSDENYIDYFNPTEWNRGFENLAPKTPGMLVEPKPGFCVKMKTLEKNKVFINFCHCDEIPRPAESIFASEKSKLDYDRELVRFPLSIAQPHSEKDKSGVNCLAFDIILNSDFYKEVVKDSAAYRECLIALSIEGIRDKYGIPISEDECILLNKPYHGTMPQHCIRCTPESQLEKIIPDAMDDLSRSNEPLMKPVKSKSLKGENKLEAKKLEQLNIKSPDLSVRPKVKSKPHSKEKSSTTSMQLVKLTPRNEPLSKMIKIMSEKYLNRKPCKSDEVSSPSSSPALDPTRLESGDFLTPLSTPLNPTLENKVAESDDVPLSTPPCPKPEPNWPNIPVPVSRLKELAERSGDSIIPKRGLELFEIPSERYLLVAKTSIIDYHLLEVFVQNDRVIALENGIYHVDISLPKPIVPEKCLANFYNGVLMVAMPWALTIRAIKEWD